MTHFQIRLSKPAKADIAHILKWTEETFGVPAANRYKALLARALSDLSSDPQLAGAKRRAELPAGVHTYHLVYSQPGTDAKTPRHFVVYRIQEKSLDILRVLHDSRDLARHVER